MNDLLQAVKNLDAKQQSSPSPAFHKELFETRLKLKQHLMSEYEYQLKRTKLNYYHSVNKPSKTHSQTHKHKLTDPLPLRTSSVSSIVSYII